MADYPTRIDLCDGKYTLIYDLSTGQSECLRHGEPWRQLVGDKMVLACFDEIVELRQQRDELLSAVKTAAEGIRRCDYTPARSTLLGAINKIKDSHNA